MIYAIGLCGALGVSAFYHRGTFSVGVRRLMRRLDHSMIYVFIAGSYTPFGLVALGDGMGTQVLTGVWLGGLFGIGTKLFWLDAPDWVSATLYVVVGSSMVLALPELIAAIGVWPVVVVAIGGAAYIVGAVVFATKRPDPWPAVFGYHEVFHALVIVGAICHFATIAVYVL